MAPPNLRKQTPPRSVLWLSLPREAAQFPSPPFSPIRRARPIFSAQQVRPARHETFRSARAFPGSRANPLARFPAAVDFLSETVRLFLGFFSALLQTICRKPASAVRSKRFSRVPFRVV